MAFDTCRTLDLRKEFTKVKFRLEIHLTKVSLGQKVYKISIFTEKLKE